MNGGRLVTSPPLLSRSVAPVTAVSVPSVTMNGGSLTRVMIRPLSTPMAVPVPIITAIPASDVSAPELCPVSMLFISTAPAIALNPRMAPSDRSMPAVMMTNVCPTARIRYSTA